MSILLGSAPCIAGILATADPFLARICFQSESTRATQHRTGHPGYPVVQLQLTCDQIHTGSESQSVKYGAKRKKRNEK